MGKQSEKEWMCVYESLAVYLKLMQHCKPAVLQYTITIKFPKNDKHRQVICPTVQRGACSDLQNISMGQNLNRNLGSGF